jgi:hypothetical protein
VAMTELFTQHDIMLRIAKLVLRDEFGWTSAEVKNFDRYFEARLRLEIETLLAHYKEQAAGWQGTGKEKPPLTMTEAADYLQWQYRIGRVAHGQTHESRNAFKALQDL